MKKLITTLALAIIMVAGTNAQINKPKISINTTKINTVKTLPGLKVNDLSKLKSLDDIKKLDAPTSQVTTEQERASSSQSWSINTLKLRDGHFSLVRLNGYISTSPLSMWAHTKENSPTGEDVESNRSNSSYYRAFPLELKFRAEAGAEYRVKIKGGRRGSNSHIYAVIKNENEQSSFISRIEINSLGDYNHIIPTNNTGNISLLFSTLAQPPGHINDWIDLYFREITLERIN